MAVKFIIDSASDILPWEAKELGVIHLPLKVRFGDREYRDAVDLSHREFYEKLVESDEFPTTCQINPAEFEEAIDAVVSAGDEAVIITLSAKLSGTYQSACIAAADYEGQAFVVDSALVSLGQRILVLRGLGLAAAGLSGGEIAAKLEEEKHRVRVMALVDTLEYLKKGGRISAAVAFAGGVLGIKPVIALEQGEVALVGKARGSRQGNNLLRKMVEECGGIHFGKPFCLAYSGLSDALLQKYIADSAELWEGHDDGGKLPVITIGCAIGTHAGPGAVAVAFFENDG